MCYIYSVKIYKFVWSFTWGVVVIYILTKHFFNNYSYKKPLPFMFLNIIN